MRKILLDTHVVIWWLLDSPELGQKSRNIVQNPDNQIFVSAATIWELSIKISKGLLELPEEIFEAIEEEDFEQLPIKWFHGKQAGILPVIHKDPFDRVLIAQAQAEGLELMTADGEIPKYGIATINAQK
ncbi:type II toxin-antitoxin system VapC family toxin [Neisseria weixii]|uniref:Type II toxin-antitoxin system VapC family toxin n=1 Tax=Neisseria weixii TaxID=1853276 RepID=A0A3N4MQM3_9NEIS|nr:type II toxin-antitoxin system VapC family toxin [Neisseria weixii]RPD86142.1 type II toxin-antitoxin system VapC family toxin [Neisseria weixii]RPD86875.1 type II toxin-antitoxin system VapC family toxin [Neisseria weixii]